jgi:hypothetical protein
MNFICRIFLIPCLFVPLFVYGCGGPTPTTIETPPEEDPALLEEDLTVE